MPKEHGQKVFEFYKIEDAGAIMVHRPVLAPEEEVHVPLADLKKWRLTKTGMPQLASLEMIQRGLPQGNAICQEDLQRVQIAAALHAGGPPGSPWSSASLCPIKSGGGMAGAGCAWVGCGLGCFWRLHVGKRGWYVILAAVGFFASKLGLAAGLGGLEPAGLAGLGVRRAWSGWSWICWMWLRRQAWASPL